MASATFGRRVRTSPLRRSVVASVTLLIAIALGGCSWQERRLAVDWPVPPSPPTGISTPPLAPPEPSPPLPQNLVASAIVPAVPVYAEPSAPQALRSLSHPTPEDYPLAFRVQERAGDWLKVFLPVRPNGSTGWIKAGDVALSGTPYRIVVELGAHRLTLFEGSNAVLQAPVAVGMAQYPTPIGEFYVDAIVKLDNPNGVYGAYQLSMAGFSEVLTRFGGGQGQLALHGTTNTAALGSNVSHGCVRLANDVITSLAQTVPVGTPVQTVA